MSIFNEKGGTAAMNRPGRLSQAAHNLLVNCAGLTSGDSLLIVHETPALGWYDAAVYQAVATEAEKRGISTRLLETGAPRNTRDEAVVSAMEEYECIMFFARIGDQDRFAAPVAGRKIVMCYTRTLVMLTSSFGRVPYQAMVDMKPALDDLINEAHEIGIHCPLGTNCSVKVPSKTPANHSDVTVLRFPMGVISPVVAGSLAGQVALADFLTPTGSGVYRPADVKLKQPVMATVESGRIIGFSGDSLTVQTVKEHYKRVAAQFDIDPDVVHSWHAGIHPGISYTEDAAWNPDRWSNTVFNHTRFLHFHTCGDYAPGEICWMVHDQTISIDGKELWKHGILRSETFEVTRRCLEIWPQLRTLYTQLPGGTGLKRGR